MMYYIKKQEFIYSSTERLSTIEQDLFDSGFFCDPPVVNFSSIPYQENVHVPLIMFHILHSFSSKSASVSYVMGVTVSIEMV